MSRFGILWKTLLEHRVRYLYNGDKLSSLTLSCERRFRVWYFGLQDLYRIHILGHKMPPAQVPFMVALLTFAQI